jgi:hypothetical protein
MRESSKRAILARTTDETPGHREEKVPVLT